MVLAICAVNLPHTTPTCLPGILDFQPSSVPLRNQSQMTAAFVVHVREIQKEKLI